MNSTLNFSPWPYFADDEIEAAEKVLRSGKVNYWTGDEGCQFEKEWSDYIGTPYAVAMSNGTVTLEAALYALGVGVGDEVIVTPRSFIASSSAAVMRGAIPVFADVEANSQNITAKTIEKVITPKTKAIILVHLAGFPCEMDEIMALAEKNKLFVIEDCAQAHGAAYKNKKVGSIGHIGSFSFCQDKIMTLGGEGGMVTTHDKNLWEKMWSFKDHGKSYEAVYHREHPPGFRWLHEDFGTNFRLTEMQSAIGRCQLKKLDDWLKIRKRNADILTSYLKAFDCIRIPTIPDYIQHAHYKYYCFINLKKLKQGWSRDRIMQEIMAQGVPCFSGSCSELYLEKAFEKNNLCPKQRLPIAQQLGETSLMFLIHPTLTEEMMHAVGQIIQSVLQSASR